MEPRARKKLGWFAVLGPGLLVAATGVGAGDLATAAFTGSELGTVVLWAVVVGALLKFFLNEGLARWQIATGETLLEGAMNRLGRPVKLFFPVYLLVWSFCVGAALASACGATAQAMFPLFDDPVTGKRVFGVALSLLGVGLVRAGGYRLFEKVMAVCIAVMFATVVATAVLVRPDWGGVLSGLVPSLPSAGPQLTWTVALMGGVGGTLTVLCYGYWLREEGRDRPEHLGLARIDLGVGYAMTAVFGLCMVVIGSRVHVQGGGSGLIVGLADQLAGPLGPAGRWAFLIGAFGAVFSSLLGVWQSVPYVFADYGRLAIGLEEPPTTKARAYRIYLYALGTVPLLGLFVSFREIQMVYAVVGALFIPLLALVLLVMNGRSSWVGKRFANRPATVIVLAAALLLFAAFAWLDIARRL